MALGQSNLTQKLVFIITYSIVIVVNEDKDMIAPPLSFIALFEP
jgi:hypothetical protein